MLNTLIISAADRCKIASIIIENEDFVEAIQKVGFYFTQKGDHVYGLLFALATMHIQMCTMYCKCIKILKEDDSAKHDLQ